MKRMRPLDRSYTVEGPTKKISLIKILQAIREMRPGKAAGPSEVNTEMITACGKASIKMMVKLCQQVLDGRGIPNEQKMSVVVPTFKGKGN